MKFLNLLLLLLFFDIAARGQSHWIHFNGGVGNDGSAGITVDAAGNIISAGWFSAGMMVGTQNLLTHGGTDGFLVKTDADGVYQWSKNIGGTGDDRAIAVTADAAGNIYLTGFFSGTMSSGAFSVTSNGSQDVFLLKLDPSGNELWMVSGGGQYNDAPAAITTDAAGNVFITGAFIGNATFAGVQLQSQTDPFSGFPSQDIFVACYSSSGILQWLKQGSGPYADKGVSIASDASGNVYVTGQFSDTLQLDIQHPNTIQNAIFLVKYNASGTEQWFTMIGGGSYTTSRSLISDNQGSLYLAGDFAGNALFFGPPALTVSNPYPNRVFIAKYDTSGLLKWVKANGSSSAVRAGAIAFNATGGLQMAGSFVCKFNEYSDAYGQGIFNSVGFSDVFVSGYDTAGTRLWSRQLGGTAEDDLKGLAISASGESVIAGNFSNRFIYPASSSFIIYEQGAAILSAASGTICNDPQYGNYRQRQAAGGSDLFYGKAVDLSRQPYDFYARSSGPCITDPVPGCISLHANDNVCQPQTAVGCGGIPLYANTMTSSAPFGLQNASPGPDFNYLWNTGQITKSITANAPGTYTVTATSADGCYSFTDSMSVSVNSEPSSPTITDSKNVNINTSFPSTIFMCVPDSVTIWVTNLPAGATASWFFNGQTAAGPSITIYANAALNNQAVVTVTDSNGCTAITGVPIIISAVQLSAIQPYIAVPDTVSVCDGSSFTASVMDSVTGMPCNIPQLQAAIWSIAPTAGLVPGLCLLNQSVDVYPASPGMYSLQCILQRSSCGLTDYDTITRQVYVLINPSPVVNGSFSAGPITELCPGTGISLSASGGAAYLWNNFATTSSITVTFPGTYCVTVRDTNSFGCAADTVFCTQVTYVTAPQIATASTPAIICPGDSVLIYAITPGIAFEWVGPAGILNGTSDSVYANLNGNYYCNLTTASGCKLASNTVELLNYATPYISVQPSTVFCMGDSVELNIQASGTAFIQWDFPLSGNSMTQYVQNAGTYSCSITSCGITSYDTVTLQSINVYAYINQNDTAICFGDTLTLQPAPFNGSATWYPGGIMSNSLDVTTSGVYYMVITDPNGCTAASNAVIVSADTVQGPLMILATTPLCEGEQLMISPVLVSGTAVQWTGPNGFSQTSSDIIIDSIQPQQGGYYVIQITDGACKSEPDSIEIVVYDSVPGYQIIYSPLCDQDTVLLSASPGLVYQSTWTTPSGLISNDSVLIIFPYDAGDAGYYLLYVENGTCPPYLDSIYLDAPQTGNVQLNVPDPVACMGDTILVNAIASPGIINWIDTTITGNQFASVNPQQVYCTLTDTGGCVFYSDTIFTFFNSPPSVTATDSITACIGDNIQLSAVVTPGTLSLVQTEWNGPGGFFSSLNQVLIQNATLASSGYYLVSVEDSVCEGNTDSVLVQVNEAPALPQLNSNLPVCFGDTLELAAGFTGAGTFTWTDPAGNIHAVSNLSVFPASLNDQGIYFAMLSVPGCPSATDSIIVTFDSCKVADQGITIPNVFTPNGDGINELFLPDLPEGEDGIMQICNRWGDKIWQGKITAGWNGTNENGEQQPAGVYYFILKPFHDNAVWKIKNGFLELLY